MALVLLGGCGRPGAGTIHGIRDQVELPGSYWLHRYGDREHVWVPRDDERPLVALRLAPNPRVPGQPAVPCGPDDTFVGTSSGGFRWSRVGSTVKLKLATSPQDQMVHFSRCVPPGEESLGCTASYNDGTMSSAREQVAMAACRSLVLR